MKKYILLIVFSIVTCVVHAQITTGKSPYGLQMKKDNRISIPNVSVQKEVKAFTNTYKARIAEEDLVNDAEPGPLRYAFAVPVNYTPENSGTWQELSDGSKLWRLKVTMSGALSINTYYNRFWLPEGAQFFVYSEETKQYIGAITSEFIGGSKEQPIEFATALIYRENAVFEYFQPASVKESAIISISRIDHGYRYIDNPYQSMLRDFGESANCQVNINCSEGNNWQNEKHAVARVSVVGQAGSGWCSCESSVNNTQNYTPYVLTANHCLAGLDAISNSNANSWVFYWEYEHPGCANSTVQPALRTTTGSIVKA